MKIKMIGCRPSHRNRWIFLQSKFLNLQEFLLFEFFIDQMDFDLKHTNFGTFEFFPIELVPIFNTSKRTIFDWFKGLLKKGLISPFDISRKIYIVKNPERYINSSSLTTVREEKDQSNEKILQKLCFISGNLQKNALKQTNILRSDEPKALDSFKVVKGSLRSDEFYQSLYEKEGYKKLLPEDMKWLDENY